MRDHEKDGSSNREDEHMLREVAERWVSDLWQGERCDLSALDELHAPDFVDHSPAGRGTDNAAFRAMLVEFFEAFPDFHGVIDDLVVDDPGNKVAMRWTAIATHRGAYLGVGPTGRRIVFRGIEILAIRDGRVTDRWGEWDGMDLLRQLDGDVGFRPVRKSSPSEGGW